MKVSLYNNLSSLRYYNIYIENASEGNRELECFNEYVKFNF